MATDTEVQGGVPEGPFIQFEVCTYDTSCKYKDTDGVCIFEICVVQHNIPPTVMLWYFECIVCKTIDCIKPNHMKAHICSRCIGRMQAAEALPIDCRWCGTSITSPPSWMFSGLCPDCLGRLKKAAWEHDFNDLR